MTNWSVMLNVLLLFVVVVAIIRMIGMKRRTNNTRRFEPPVNRDVAHDVVDDIIAVRKIEPEEASASEHELTFGVKPAVETQASYSEEKAAPIIQEKQIEEPASLVLFLLAKEHRKLEGYELLQSILAAGLRFGEGQLFHRHQFANGQGPVVCSLATATADGTFDLQNMGAFSVHGLCLFMEASGNANIDEERFEIMLDTAKQLKEGLDTHLLDDARAPWSERSLKRYRRLLNTTREDETLSVV